MNTPAGVDGQMSEALRNMAAHRAASHAVDRRGWTSQQWADDAKRLMSDLDGSVSSLLNGHVLGLIAERDAAVARAEAAEQAAQRVRAETAEQIIEAIKVRREHYIACGGDLGHTAGMYEAVAIIQQLIAEEP